MSLIAKLRTVFTFGQGVTRGLPELAAGNDPIALFGRWFEDAQRSGILLPESMALATSNAAGHPAVRMVLLKSFDDQGFVFFSNYGSRKAQELLANPHAALVFHWAVLERQVRIEGTVERLPAGESATYFRTRSRGSRIGAWASRQSEALTSREELKRRVQDYEAKFAGADIPYPDFWGGFHLAPRMIEFWQGRANRLHDRLCYSKCAGPEWSVTRLYP